MTLEGPSPEDLRKIHGEVNQLVNQRFLLTTAAVTIYGAFTAWLLPRQTPAPGAPTGGFIYAMSLALLCTLFVLYLFKHMLLGMLRIFTTYLDVTAKSGWEQDWAAYRRKYAYLGYTKPQTLVFAFLGGLVLAMPFALQVAYGLTAAPTTGMWLLILGTVAYELAVILMGFNHIPDVETKTRERWVELSK